MADKMGPEWKGNEDVFEAVNSDRTEPLELHLQTLRVWLEVAEIEHKRGDRRAVSEALKVVEDACRDVISLVSDAEKAPDVMSDGYRRFDQLTARLALLRRELSLESP